MLSNINGDEYCPSYLGTMTIIVRLGYVTLRTLARLGRRTECKV